MSYRMDTSVFKTLTEKVSKTEQAIKKAKFRAVNRVATSARAEASREIRKQVKLPAAYVNKNLTVNKRATLESPEASVGTTKDNVSMAQFGPKQMTRSIAGARGDALRGIGAGRVRAGVSVHVSPAGGRKKARKWFLLPLKGQNRMGVFRRVGTPLKGRDKPGGKRLYQPYIEQVFGPSIYQVFQGVRKDLQPSIRRKLVKEFKAQFRFASGGGR